MVQELKILCLDIENFPCVVYTWELGEVNIPLEFLVRDFNICAWSAKWLDSDEIMYMDNRGKRDIYNDKQLVKGLIKLINQADIIIGQNVKRFDLRKLATRAEFYDLEPFRPCPVIDILTEERRVFAHTSHKLAYKTERNKKYKKLKHEAYPGFDLWVACMADKLDAWKHMEEYCKHDVLSTEERYLKVQGWIRTPHLGTIGCRCGNTKLQKRGYANTDAGKFQIFHCKVCGKWPRSPINLLTKETKRARLRENQ